MATHIELQVINDKTGQTSPQIFLKSDMGGIIADNGSGDGTMTFIYKGEEIRVKCSYEYLRDNLC